MSENFEKVAELLDLFNSMQIKTDHLGTNILVEKFTKRNLDDLLALEDREIIMLMVEAEILPKSHKYESCSTTINKITFEKDTHPFFRCRNRGCTNRKK